MITKMNVFKRAFHICYVHVRVKHNFIYFHTSTVIKNNNMYTHSYLEDPESYIGQSILNVPSPAFLVNKAKVEKNCQKMIKKYENWGIHLRPHMKTHKTIQGGILQTNGTKKSIVVSTLQEAWFYAENGFDDLLYGFPLTPQNVNRCKKLVEKLNQFHVLVNSECGVEAAEKTELPVGKKWSLFLKIDVGYQRAGIPYDQKERIISLCKRMIKSDNIEFQGLYMHCGNSYSTDLKKVKEVRDQSIKNFAALTKQLQLAGINCPNMGAGSTPSCSLPTPPPEMGIITEMHPGNYIFYDSQQESYGSCHLDDVAVRVMTRIVSHHLDRNQMMVDLGFTGFTKQGLDLSSKPGYGIISEPNLKLVAMTQELGKIETIDGSQLDPEKLPIGKNLFIYPYHACATAGMYPWYYVHDENDIVTEIWKPTRGW